MQQLQSYLDSVINTSLFAAIKISGRFASVKYKCFYPQQRPYKPISESPAKFFDSSNIKGTMVGFFTPKSAIVLNSPDYHFHFINNPATSGGHMEDCIIENVTIEVDYADELHIKLPPKQMLADINLNQPVKE